MPLQLHSSAFAQGETIPTEHTCDGNDTPSEWSGAPEGTVSFLLVCDDPDAPDGRSHHWAAYNIPGDWKSLEAGAGSDPGEGFRQAVNGFGNAGYGGPCPPEGDTPHAYHFRLSALNGWIDSAAPSADCAEIQRLAGPIIAGPIEIKSIELIGFYGR